MALFLILLIALGVVFTAIFMLWFTDKVTKAALTDRFQDAEFILEHHRAPAAWSRPKSILVLLMQRSGSVSLRDHLQYRGDREKREERTKTRVLRRLDELVVFFETCPFFQDEESRKVLLEKLHLERASWKQKKLDDIIAQDSPT